METEEKSMTQAPFDPPGLQFYDERTSRYMKYVYPDAQGAPEHVRGWILYRHPDGQWVTYRKANDKDIEAINKMVSDAHHFGV